jgi:hypothetical protein
MQEVPYSILDLFSERVHELGRTLFNFSCSDLAANAQASAARGCLRVGSRPLILMEAPSSLLGLPLSLTSLSGAVIPPEKRL